MTTSVIDPARIPEYIRQDLAQVCLDGFLAFRERVRADPEAEREFQRRVEEYRAERRAKTNKQKGEPA